MYVTCMQLIVKKAPTPRATRRDTGYPPEPASEEEGFEGPQGRRHGLASGHGGLPHLLPRLTLTSRWSGDLTRIAP